MHKPNQMKNKNQQSMMSNLEESPADEAIKGRISIPRPDNRVQLVNSTLKVIDRFKKVKAALRI